MAGNYLEQLLAEWYEYQGYFVRKNVWVGLRPKGGYDCELDIVAYHPSKRHLLHIEPSMDAYSWAVREHRFRKKFDAGKKYIPGLFKGFQLPPKIEQIALLGVASKQNHQEIGGGRIVLAKELILEILRDVKNKALASRAVPEKFPILRSLQFIADYRNDVIEVLEEKH